MTSRSILIVENDASTRQLVEVLLRRAGHETVTVESGGDAIALLATTAFDLAIVDLMMPRISGQDVIAYIEENTPETPVIVCTAAGPTVTNSLTSSVIRAVIRKPFNIVEFTETVDAHMQSVREAVMTVLIIDDDESARYVMRTLVEPANVLEAEDAESALHMVRAQRPDVVLLDLMLPGMQGEEFLRTLKDDPETSAIPIVIVTARKAAESEPDPALARADGYIYKGDLSRETVRTVLQVVRKPRHD